ncbi:beta-galactosidase trimerization domain-containing protein [Paenibacillus gansuensis]|uniref:Beta-galactosidase trimerization domain-containing protein n=1 Tax=Paenibacillus gansuensis TaxID=306542 RepID=A0ABW5P8R9_9BACL
MQRNQEMPFRQIHLDFHTSPYIPGVGAHFDPKQFISALKEGHVNSINLFAKCHHGMCYYPTKLGTVHPHLTFDLFGDMVKACREAGIGAVAYVPVGWEEDAAEKHPEWLQVDREGVLGGKKPFETGHYTWRHLCHNNDHYVDYVLAQTKEILDAYEIDGFWYDIIFHIGCVCGTCQKSMRELGLNPEREQDVLQHDFMSLKKFRERVTRFVHAVKPDLPVYFNTGYSADIAYTDYNIREKVRYNTHIEIESIPSGLWGYNHFPLVANYHNAKDYEIVGMTGKFHKCWGDFGTLKNRAALEYECFRMLAYGAKCSIGDQLHPSGRMEEAVYRRIGEVYRSVEEKEPWCAGSRKMADIGVLTANPDLADKHAIHHSDEGVMRMLMELHQPFDFLDSLADLTPYKLIILPDSVALNGALAEKLERYAEQGGAVLATDRSGLDLDGNDFATRLFGVTYEGPALYAPDYLRLTDSFRAAIEPMDYCFYEQGTAIAAEKDSEVLAYAVHPYFNRTHDRFCSHCQTPPDLDEGGPAIVRNGRIIYISKPIFKDYIVSGTKVYRDVIERCLELLLPEPLVRSTLPASAEVTVRRQDAQNREILHVIHYIPQKKSKEMEIVEEVLPLYGQQVRVRLYRRPNKVYLAPQLDELTFSYRDSYVEFIIPEIWGHQMVVME